MLPLVANVNPLWAIIVFIVFCLNGTSAKLL